LSALGIRTALARSLERGTLRGRAVDLLCSVWARAADVERPVGLPRDVRVIGIGGATLGGSGKSPLVRELAEALARAGEHVAVVGHGYRARVSSPRRVRPGDRVEDVGDEALWLARALDPVGVPVLVARDRSLALGAAARTRASILVVDSLLQARPERLALSVLAVDAEHPWGSGRCPPGGDLRAPPVTLLAAADRVVGIAAPGARPGALPSGAVLARGRLSGVTSANGERSPLAALSAARLGLLLAIARPERVTRSLHAHGIFPTVTWTLGDHEVPRPAAIRSAEKLDAWLTTAKCATKLGATLHGAPVLALDHRLDLPGGLVDAARGASVGSQAREAW